MQNSKTLLFGIALISLTLIYGGISRKIDRAPRDDAAFWLKKLALKPDYDLIIAGDSRMNRGLAPEILSPSLGGIKVTNFAFSGGGFEPNYLKALTELALPRKSTIVLGITPRSLTELAAKTSGFQTWYHTSSLERTNLAALHKIDLFLTPENPVMLIGRVVGHGPKYGQEMHEGGWLPGSRIPEDPRASINEYTDIFKRNKVSPEILSRFIAQIREWTKSGITVFCLRPPTTPEIVALENEKSGYDEASIRESVTSAGGIWLEIRQDKYPTFDGNHLTKQGAIDFSRDVCRLLISNELVGK